jgi:hypothetical protein
VGVIVRGKWFGKRVAEPLANKVIPDTARAVETPVRQAGQTAESAGTTVPGGDREGVPQIEQSGGAVSPPAVGDTVTREERSAEFSPAMSGQQVRETLAGLLGDRGAADIAALPVNHGLRTSGKDGVRLVYTPTAAGSGVTVSGRVEEIRVPQGGILEDHFGGAKVGEFAFNRSADGTTSSWSARFLGDRKQIGATAERLPADLTEVAPGFDTDQVRSTVADAVTRISKDKLARRGGALDIESGGDRLTVRASAGVLPLTMTSPNWILLHSTLTRTDDS